MIEKMHDDLPEVHQHPLGLVDERSDALRRRADAFNVHDRTPALREGDFEVFLEGVDMSRAPSCADHKKIRHVGESTKVHDHHRVGLFFNSRPCRGQCVFPTAFASSFRTRRHPNALSDMILPNAFVVRRLSVRCRRTHGLTRGACVFTGVLQKGRAWMIPPIVKDDSADGPSTESIGEIDT